MELQFRCKKRIRSGRKRARHISTFWSAFLLIKSQLDFLVVWQEELILCLYGLGRCFGHLAIFLSNLSALLQAPELLQQTYEAAPGPHRLSRVRQGSVYRIHVATSSKHVTWLGSSADLSNHSRSRLMLLLFLHCVFFMVTMLL